MVDAGNALFERPSNAADGRARAELLAKVMGEVGTAAMAVGTRDLASGADFALGLSRKAHLPMLSVNLRRGGKPVFPASTLVKVGGARVALIGISPAGKVPGDATVTGELPVALAVAEARKLRPKADLVIALAAIPTADALQLSRDAKGEIDLILQSSDLRAQAFPSSGGGAPIFAAGFEGRDVRIATVNLAGKGPLVLLTERRQLESRRSVLDDNLAALEKRLAAATDPGTRASLEQTKKAFQAQREQVQADLDKGQKADARTLDLGVRPLDATVHDDPALAQKVAKLEPAPSH